MNKFLKRLTAFFTGSLLLLSSNLSVFAVERGRVNCDVLNVRVSPNTDCEVVNRMYTGTTFEIVYTDNGWYNIRMNNGVTGFVSAEYVTRFTVDESQLNAVGEQIAANAQNYLGYPYVYGGSGPSSFDCSGFTSYLYKQQGYTIPRTADVQAEYGTYVDRSNLKVGDLVFFSNRSDRSINHVGIYIGNNEFIHAANSNRGVVIDSLNSNYYNNHYVTARRMV